MAYLDNALGEQKPGIVDQTTGLQNARGRIGPPRPTGLCRD